MPTSPSNTSFSAARSSLTQPAAPRGNAPPLAGAARPRAIAQHATRSPADELLAATSHRRRRAQSPWSTARGATPQREGAAPPSPRPVAEHVNLATSATEAGPLLLAGTARPRHDSMASPTSLSDPPSRRQPLLDAPEGTLARRFGTRLRELQESMSSDRIDRPTFVALALDEALESLTDAVRRGATSADAIKQARAQRGLTHDADIRELGDVAFTLSVSGGQRVPGDELLGVQSELAAAVRGGATPGLAVRVQHATTRAVSTLRDADVAPSA